MVLNTGQMLLKFIKMLPSRELGVGLAEILLRPLLILDARLHILVIQIEFAEAVVGAVASVVFGKNSRMRSGVGTSRPLECAPAC